MSSLRHQTIFTPFTATTTASRHPSAQPPLKKQKKMSLSQTYFLAHTARGKLSAEASRADHDLRLLVGHANLLDALMLDLHEAEREQEAWVEAAVSSASSAAAKKQPASVKWVDREMELDNSGSSDEEADSDSSDEEMEDDEDNFSVPLRRIRSPPPTKQPVYYNDIDEADYSDEDEDDFYDDEFDASLSLVRTQSHSPDFTHHISGSSSSSSSSSSASSTEVPELVHDSDPESDDESSPPNSPTYPQLSLASAGIVVTDFSSKTPQKPQVATVFNEDLLHPNRQSPMVAAY